ncbi:MAG: hypothetical protein C0490_12320, partial [Marivirga sp.]|nr:hypothetical protein [Marivirga sp.]
MSVFRFVIVIILLFPLIDAQSQDYEIKKLKDAISNSPDDSVKVNNLIELSKAYLETDLQAAINYGVQAKDMAQKLDFKKGLGYSYKAIAIGYYSQSNYPEALIQFQNSLDIFESISFKTGIANILSNIGAVYNNTGDDTKAIEYHLKSLKVSEEINDRLRISTALNNIGGVYKNKAVNNEKALDYFLRAYSIFQDIGYSDGVGIASMNIGEIYKDQRNYDSAIFYFDKSL